MLGALNAGAGAGAAATTCTHSKDYCLISWVVVQCVFVHFLDFVQGVGYGFFVNCEETVLRDMFLPPFFFVDD